MEVAAAPTLLFFALGAFVVPLGAGQIGMPAAVGEILYGILIGPHVLGLAGESHFVSFLAQLGFAFLMFLAGLELDFAHIERQRKRDLLVEAATAGLVFVLAMLLAEALRLPGYYTLVFGAMSVGIVLVALNDARLLRTPLGQRIIFIGSVGEGLTIVLLTGLSVYFEFGLGLPFAAEVGKLAAIFAIAYVVLVVLRTMIWWWPHHFSRVTRSDDPSEVGVRAGMALMIAFVALAALLGMEAILGAFVAGALFSFVFRHKGMLESKLSSIGFGFFVPVFFIWVGTEFDVTAVFSLRAWGSVGVLLGASLCAKLLPALLLVVRGQTVRESIASGVLLGAPLTLLVAIARIGERIEVLRRGDAAAVVLLAMITGVIFPYAFRLLLGSAQSGKPVG